MWVLKLKTEAKHQFLGQLALKHNISLIGYPLSFELNQKNVLVMVSGTLLGPKKNKEKFLAELKQSKKLLNLEVNNDFAIAKIQEPQYMKYLYNPNIIRVSPDIISNKGQHIWTLASFDRQVLSAIIKHISKKINPEILFFKEKNLSNITFTKVAPTLTSLQKKALEIAIQEGYYTYPKQVTLTTLAKIMKISYSTFQAHLKKAEGKILPNIYKEMN